MSGNRLIPYCDEPSGFWKDIPGLDGFQASIEGDIRRLYKKGYRVLTPYFRHGKRSIMHIKIGRKECNASRLIWNAFYGDVPEGKVIGHRDGIASNMAANNLIAVTRQELGARTGPRSASKCVAKYDPVSKECVALYMSARECARQNFFSYQAILDRCNGRVKRSPASDGYEYCWEDDGYNTSYNRMIKRINTRGA